MSDHQWENPGPGPAGPGWWLASDGRYYPPEQAADHAPPAPAGYPPYAPYSPGRSYGQSVAPYVHQTTNGLAIASLVVGILWIYWLGSVLALVFGYVARSQIRSSRGRQGGGGMAIAGIVLGWVGLTIGALIIVLAVVVDSTDGIDSDPSDGHCNGDRFMQDPDC